MLTELASIIDALYDRKRAGKSLRKRLVFLVGNGIHPVNNILDDTALRPLATARGITSPAAYEAFKWRHFEYARYYTANSLPSFAHCCVSRLVRDGLCRHIITTNYDLYFDEIWRRHPALGLRTNPVGETNEYLWEGYYSSRHGPSGFPCYWKVHGSLSHVVFHETSDRSRYHLFRLPRFAISVNNSDLAATYHIPTQAPFLGFEKTRWPVTHFCEHDHLEPSFTPFIDWTYSNDRSRYRREIEGAKRVLSKPSTIAALIIIGFSGFYDDSNPSSSWNEEIVPVIRSLIGTGFSDVYMAVHEAQYQRAQKTPGNYGLVRHLDDEGRCARYASAGAFVSTLLGKRSRKFPFSDSEREYEQWSRCEYLNEPEGTHG